MKLQILDNQFSVSRLDPQSVIPEWAFQGHFFSVTRTKNELSIVCEGILVPVGIKSETGWRILKVDGILDFNLTGILASITNPLAEAKISIFAISTFDTDYVLVKESDLEIAGKVLRSNGFQFY
jgi:hypothetical protein